MNQGEDGTTTSRATATAVFGTRRRNTGGGVVTSPLIRIPISKHSAQARVLAVFWSAHPTCVCAHLCTPRYGATCVPCDEGMHGKGGLCKRAPDGFTPTANRTAIVKCPSGARAHYFVPESPHIILIELRQALISYQYHHMVLLTLAGTYGRAGAGGVKIAGTCERCPLETHPSGLRTHCEPCPPTHYGVVDERGEAQGVCEVCDNGKQPAVHGGAAGRRLRQMQSLGQLPQLPASVQPHCPGTSAHAVWAFLKLRLATASSDIAGHHHELEQLACDWVRST